MLEPTRGSSRFFRRVRRDRMREERLCLARHLDNGPAVLCPACLQRLLADRSLNSVRNGDDAITVDASGHEIITDRTGSPLSERLVRPASPRWSNCMSLPYLPWTSVRMNPVGAGSRLVCNDARFHRAAPSAILERDQEPVGPTSAISGSRAMLNRGVVIVRPKQPYLDWAAELDDSGIVPDYLRMNSMGGTLMRRLGQKIETSRCSRRGLRSNCTRYSRISATTRSLMRMLRLKVLFMSAFTSGAIEDYDMQIARGEPCLVKPSQYSP